MFLRPGAGIEASIDASGAGLARGLTACGRYPSTAARWRALHTRV